MIRRAVVSLVILIACTVSLTAQEPYPEVHVSYAEDIMEIGNPSAEQLTLRALWLFWDSPKNLWCDLDLRIPLESKTINTIQLQDLASFRNKHRENPTPRCIAILMHGEEEGSWYCNYYEMNERGIYQLNDDSSEFLTETVQKLPGYLGR